MTKKELQDYIDKTYGISPDYPFDDDLDTAVYRHAVNKKWFAISMAVKREKLGLGGGGNVDVVNIKCPAEIIDSMWQESGIFPAYHMNKNHWLTLALDGTAEDGTITWLLSLSYDLTLHKKKGI